MVAQKIVLGLFCSCLVFDMSVSEPQRDGRVGNNASGIDNPRARANRREKYNGKILFEALDHEPLLPLPAFPSASVASNLPEQNLWNKNVKPTKRIPIKEVTDNFITTKSHRFATSPSPTKEYLRTTTVISNKSTRASTTTPKTTSTSSNPVTIRTEEPILEGHYYIPFRKMIDKPRTQRYYRRNPAFS